VDNRPLILEGDAGGLIIWSTEFKEWLLESREQFFAVKPGGYPPYFDGQSIFYALLSFITDGFSTAQGPMILTYRYVNALAWVGGGLLMFSSAWQVCGNAILSTALVFLYATTPALLEVSLLRIDHLIMCLFMAMIAISLWIADRPTPISMGVLLGAVMALAVATKISSVLLCSVCVPAIAVAFRRGWWSLHHVVALLGAAALLSALFFLRYLFYWRDFIWILTQKYSDTQSWVGLVPRTPWLYYSWTFPVGQFGLPFTVVALAASGLALIYSRRSVKCAVVAWPLLGLTLFGIPQMKYDHFGLSFLPFYLLAPAAVLPFFRERKLRIAWILAPILAFPFSFGHYAGLVYAALERNRSIEVTRIAPGRWIAEQVRPGTRVGFYSQSNVTLPQIWDMPYNFSTELFNFPYLDADKMRQFRPPSFADLEARYDVLLLSDCHVWIYDYTFQRYGAEDRRAEWSNFVEELGRRYRTIRFAAPTPNYCVKEVDIYVIHPEALTARPLESERPTLH
jgi:4-amino-4-deoxy-L-arabinose transferase-like glycosyltransferase